MLELPTTGFALFVYYKILKGISERADTLRMDQFLKHFHAQFQKTPTNLNVPMLPG